MCGIAGYITRDGSQPPAAALRDFIAVLRHRGPDGSGVYEGQGLAFSHTRLAIIDLATGDQPLYGPEQTALVANGEIYNYLELRQEFPGAEFVTQSDSELPLFAYGRSHGDFTRRLRGMYAIALHDAKSGSVFLARDPFGIKPLYYAQTAGGLVFASEPAALLKSELVKRKIRREVATELLQLQFTTGRDTIFSGIARVLPGETIEVRRGEIVGRTRREMLPDGPPRDISETDALKQLDNVLMDSVAVHQRSDVPYGMFLSGGVDSSALLACMARLNDRPVLAFTAGFPATAVHDERGHAERVAKAVGAEHISMSVTEQDFYRCLPAVVATLDDPAADYATLPTFLLAKEAARHVKVVLSGEGGDELFAGYGRYRSAMRPRLLGGRPVRRRGFLAGMSVLRRDTGAWATDQPVLEKSLRGRGWNRLQTAQAMDCAGWLPDDLLIKLDRCLMAHGVEGRTPFLDPVVADFAFRLPDRLKVANGQGKYLLRRWLDGALPEAHAFAPKKGFNVPVREWIMRRADTLGSLVSRSEGVMELCNPDAVQRVFAALAREGGKREGFACWQLLFYALWHRIHIEGVQPQADVVAVLEASA